MIALELTYPKSIVRIHDECCQTASERQITAINGIVSESYKRRFDASGEFPSASPNSSAFPGECEKPASGSSPLFA